MLRANLCVMRGGQSNLLDRRMALSDLVMCVRTFSKRNVATQVFTKSIQL